MPQNKNLSVFLAEPGSFVSSEKSTYEQNATLLTQNTDWPERLHVNRSSFDAKYPRRIKYELIDTTQWLEGIIKGIRLDS